MELGYYLRAECFRVSKKNSKSADDLLFITLYDSLPITPSGLRKLVRPIMIYGVS